MFWLAFQVRIGFCYREQAAQGRGQLVLGAGQLLHCSWIARVGLGGGQPADRGASRRYDGFEGFALVFHVAFGGLDQIRDQVVAPLQLHIDLRERVLVAVTGGYQPVVDGNEKEDYRDNDAQQN
jgi:hypothetical protein